MKKKTTKKIPRNGSALAAKMRHGGPMKHRLEPKKGAKNTQAEIIDEYCQDEDDDEFEL
jgi:hypothetical protein